MIDRPHQVLRPSLETHAGWTWLNHALLNTWRLVSKFYFMCHPLQTTILTYCSEDLLCRRSAIRVRVSIHANSSAVGRIFWLLWSNFAIPTGIPFIMLLALFASGKNPVRYYCIELCRLIIMSPLSNAPTRSVLSNAPTSHIGTYAKWLLTWQHS